MPPIQPVSPDPVGARPVLLESWRSIRGCLAVLALVACAGGIARSQVAQKGKMAVRGASPEIAAAPGWTVKADPPPEPLKIPDEAVYSIASPTGEGVTYPTTPSPFVALGQNEKPTDVRQVFDLRTGQAVGAIRGKYDFSDDAKLSPDGQFLLTESRGGPPVPSRSIEIWSFRTGQVVKKIEASPTPATIGLLGFAAGNQPVTSRYIGKGDLISVWDLATGRLGREILGPPSFRKEATALSPGGRYLALVSNDPNLVVIDLTTGARVGEKAIPKGGASYLAPEGLTFSPDGAELAGLFGAGAETRLLVWDVGKGEIVVDHTLKGNAKLNVPGAQSYKGRAVEWLPDGSAWLIFGHTLVDRAGGRPVWIFRSAPNDFSPGPRILVDEDRMLVVAGTPREARRLEIVPLPWPKVDAALKAIEARVPAFVRPGQPVSLKVEVGKVRFGTPEESRVAITQTLTERLKAEGIEVAEGQPTVLYVTYSEALGETLHEMKSNGPLPGLGGTPTGRTVQATKALCELAWEAAGTKKPLWSDRLNFDPSSLMVRGEATDAKARESAFNVLKSQLAGLPIPYFLPRDAALSSLPGVTALTSADAKRTNRATTKPTRRGQPKAK